MDFAFIADPHFPHSVSIQIHLRACLYKLQPVTVALFWRKTRKELDITIHI